MRGCFTPVCGLDAETTSPLQTSVESPIILGMSSDPSGGRGYAIPLLAKNKQNAMAHGNFILGVPPTASVVRARSLPA